MSMIDFFLNSINHTLTNLKYNPNYQSVVYSFFHHILNLIIHHISFLKK